MSRRTSLAVLLSVFTLAGALGCGSPPADVVRANPHDGTTGPLGEPLTEDLNGNGTLDNEDPDGDGNLDGVEDSNSDVANRVTAQASCGRKTRSAGNCHDLEAKTTGASFAGAWPAPPSSPPPW
jgi:hypothetical protein